MKKILQISLILLLISGSFSSCKKQLDVQPRQSLDAEIALTNREGIEAALTSVYARLKSPRLYGRDLIAISEALSDNGRATNRSGRLLAEAQNNHNAHFASWQISYFAINQANLILEALPKVDMTAAQRDRLEGETRFLRGLIYFDLVKVYAYIPGAVVEAANRGGVPIVTTGTKNLDSAITRLPARAPIADVYNFVIADLTAAAGKLGNAATNSQFPYVATRQAAHAILSRVQLYNKNFGEAKRWSDSVINRQTAATYTLTDASTHVQNWRNPTHRESIFEVRFASQQESIGVNESLQTTFTSLKTVGDSLTVQGTADLVPSNTLLAALGITVSNNGSATAAITARTADVRNLLFERGVFRNSAAFVETTKFMGKNGFPNLDNVPVIRVAEMYLNRAEAMATPGSSVFNEASALADVNTIRQARRLPAVTGLTGTALMNEIMLQRRLEFAFEGHRFFDLKRLGLNLTKGPHYNDVAFTDYRILPAIPQREIDANPINLAQNIGY
jgi:hypothetical protein